MNAICAAGGVSFEPQIHDDDSKDITLKKLLDNPKFHSNIGVQLKSSSGNIDKGDYIKYRLKKKNYDDLRTRATMRTYLFLFLIPGDEEEWINQDNEKLILKKCMYFLDLSELEDSENSETVTITVPKKNVVSVNNIIALLEKEREEA